MNDPESTKKSPEPNGSYQGDVDGLHDLMAAPTGTDEEDPLAALRNDPNYAALIRDLEYIAVEARRLFEPAQEDPSDKVWEKIQKELDNKPHDV